MFDFIFPLYLENKSAEEDLPSMETSETSKTGTIQSISTYFGTEDQDIPDMEEYEDPDAMHESDAVRRSILKL